MKENLELVEKLVEKTGLSYTEARDALEKVDWDILEAIIQLEAQGKIHRDRTAEYTTRAEASKDSEKEKKQESHAAEDFKKTTKGIGRWMREIFDKGNTNFIELHKNGEKKLGMPVTVFVLLLVFGFWFLIPIMVVSLFFGCRYCFSGADLGKECLNSALGKATDIAENIKSEFKSAEKKAPDSENSESK
ncbi:MAG: DUF4342 domain-containing protein [Oscillospiraceae bacterium]